jgi:hypothetical protein
MQCYYSNEADSSRPLASIVRNWLGLLVGSQRQQRSNAVMVGCCSVRYCINEGYPPFVQAIQVALRNYRRDKAQFQL